MMILTSCGNDTASDSTTSGGKGGSGGETTVNYGSVDSPLSVEDLYTEVAKLKLANDGYSNKPFFATGLINLASVSYFSIGEGKTRVYDYTVATGVDTPYQNDTVVVEGYIKCTVSTYDETYYYNFSKKDTTAPTVHKTTRGTSTVTTSVDNATISGLNETYTNGATATFTVAPTSGYKIYSVSANEETLTQTDGSYSFTVKGDSEVEVLTQEEGDTSKIASVKLTGSLFTSSEDKKSATYTNSGIEFTLTKESSTTAINFSTTELRVYKNAKFALEVTGTLKKVVFKSADKDKYNDYYPNLSGATFTGGTVDSKASSSEKLTAVVNAAADVSELSFLAGAGQVRLTKAVVYYN